jgi:hypothetical protein
MKSALSYQFSAQDGGARPAGWSCVMTLYLGTGIFPSWPDTVSEACMTTNGISFHVHCSIWRRYFDDIESLIFAFGGMEQLASTVTAAGEEGFLCILIWSTLTRSWSAQEGISLARGKKKLLPVHHNCSLCMCIICFPCDVYVGDLLAKNESAVTSAFHTFHTNHPVVQLTTLYIHHKYIIKR